jgi:hypothetical protein
VRSSSSSGYVLPTILSFIPFVVGVALLAVGVGYDVFYVGIPYQDPPPALELKYQEDGRTASRIEGWGGDLILLGLGTVVVTQVVLRMHRPSYPR